MGKFTAPQFPYQRQNAIHHNYLQKKTTDYSDYSDYSDGIRIPLLSNNKDNVEQHEQLSSRGVRAHLFQTTD